MKKILLVEDTRSFAAMVVSQLEQQLHAQVTVCATKAEAIKELTANRADYFIAILDLCLPDAEKSQVVDLTDDFEIPAIIFTGNVHNSVREDLLHYPRVADYVIKNRPNAMEYVAETIRRLNANQLVHALVVDDSRLSRELARNTLQSQLINVTTLESAEQATAYLDHHPEVSLVVTDGELEGMDGIALTTEMRRTRGLKDLIIIGVSGNYSRTKSIEFLKAGANDFLSKPFQFEELSQRANSNLNILSQMRELEIAKENQRVLLDMAANNISNPLGKMVAITGLMRQKPAALDKYLELMETSTKQLMSLVTGIVDYSKACMARLNIRQQHIHCQALFQPLLPTLEDQAREKNICISFEHNYVNLTADPVLLGQVLNNLISNAIQFSMEGTLIDISCHIINSRKVIQIRDQGSGISDQDLNKLFVPFAKIGNEHDANNQSNGLGLALCKQLIDAHSGTIWFTSNAPLAGVTAHIQLPQ
ncbi:MAG: response regulator [Gammaproteobacteria bacterium]|jgi:signal transduction histidine kinase|nr:response regulator [Gammaproteobacteria bacterium]